MPWTPEDDVNIAEAPYAASTGSVTGVKGWLVKVVARPEDPGGFRQVREEHVFQCKPGALGPLEANQTITVNAIAYRYLGEAEHGTSIFQHLLLTREV